MSCVQHASILVPAVGVVSNPPGAALAIGHLAVPADPSARAIVAGSGADADRSLCVDARGVAPQVTSWACESTTTRDRVAQRQLRAEQASAQRLCNSARSAPVESANGAIRVGCVVERSAERVHLAECVRLDDVSRVGVNHGSQALH